jgi:esterase
MKLFHKSYGSGPPIIILHGLFGLGDNWRTIARKLEEEYQCIIPDQRNHGRSPHDPVMNWDVMASDVHELIEDLDLDEVILMGHSMGGKVAMQFATTYPELVDKLIVVDMAPKIYPPHHKTVIKAINALDPATCKSREDAEQVLRQYIQDDEATIQFLLKNISRTPEGNFEWKANMPGIIAAYDALMQDIAAMHPYLGPTLFVKGEFSNYVSEDDMPVIRQLFPAASLVEITGAGHWIHADKPEEFVAEIHRFLSA